MNIDKTWINMPSENFHRIFNIQLCILILYITIMLLSIIFLRFLVNSPELRIRKMCVDLRGI